jgi:hypothetical protein
VERREEIDMIDRLARDPFLQPVCHIPSPIKAGGLGLLAALICGGAANAQIVLPNDAKPTCTVSGVKFALG